MKLRENEAIVRGNPGLTEIKIKGVLKKSLVLLTILLLVSFVIIEGVILMEGRKEEPPQVDYVIVLGARLYGDLPSPALLERLRVAKGYLLENGDSIAVVTGGQGMDELIPEAHAMKKYLVENGIENERIIVEDRATSTFENMKYSRELIMDNETVSPKVLIVTNSHHIFRAEFLARRQGMDPYGLPAKIPPSIVLQSYVREYFAVVKSLIFDH
ncbi:MAG TPA: YdcF family protein [Tissierellaceae bacterium]|jgi:uncharacterized SAM-binding protein YcdF (DUF218 family)|nr:YdcF family protein [Tissierellaceae bacterium]